MKFNRWRKTTSYNFKNDRQLIIPQSILERTGRAFLEYNKKNQEAIAYWFGKENDSEKTDIALCLVIPKAYHSGGNYEVPVEETARIGHAMIKQSLVSLAQIHTHPGIDATHSYYDDDHSLSKRNGFLSLVIPNYGRISYNDLDDITVHECWDGNWHVLSNDVKGSRIKIVDDFIDFRIEDLDKL